MNSPTRLCYLISSPKGFLLGFDYSEPEWGCAAHQALERSYAWLDLQVANQKLKAAQALLPQLTLSLVLLEFVKEGIHWRPLSQRGVA
jgi:hypothetical protein